MEKYLKALEQCIRMDDTEIAHVTADAVLCNIINDVLPVEDAERIIAAYNKVNKWYA